MTSSVSIIIPAFNEERNIEDAVASAVYAAKQSSKEYEILLINDGSIDRTGEKIDDIVKKNKHCRAIHQNENLGFGATIRRGISEAKKDYVIGFPGDNDTSGESLADIIRKAHEADVIISYTVNTSVRGVVRHFFSKGFIVIMNILFGLHLRYFNGSYICKTTKLQKIPLTSRGFMIYAEAKVRLLKNGASYKEVPFIHIGRKYGESKAFNLQSLVITVGDIMTLVRDIYFG